MLRSGAVLARWRRGNQAAARVVASAALIEITEPAGKPSKIPYRPITVEDVSRQLF
jgi:hypothetical protein